MQTVWNGLVLKFLFAVLITATPTTVAMTTVTTVPPLRRTTLCELVHSVPVRLGGVWLGALARAAVGLCRRPVEYIFRGGRLTGYTRDLSRVVVATFGHHCV